MPQTKLAQAVMTKIFAYLTAHKGKTVGPFTIEDSVVDENTDNPNGILDGFPLRTIKLKPTADKNCNELFYFHVTLGRPPVPVIHFHRYHGNNVNDHEAIYHQKISKIITGTEYKVDIEFSANMNLTGLPRIINDPREQLLADLADKYPNPYYSGSLDNFKDNVVSKTVTKLMDLCFDKYIVRATLRNELANKI